MVARNEGAVMSALSEACRLALALASSALPHTRKSNLQKPNQERSDDTFISTLYASRIETRRHRLALLARLRPAMDAARGSTRGRLSDDRSGHFRIRHQYRTLDPAADAGGGSRVAGQSHRSIERTDPSCRPLLWRCCRLQDCNQRALRHSPSQVDLDRTGVADVAARKRRGQASARPVRGLPASDLRRSLGPDVYG